MTASPNVNDPAGFADRAGFTHPAGPTDPAGPTAPAGSTDPAGFATSHATRAQTRRLYRSPTNRVFAGVCGGIAEYYGADPSAVRLLTAVIALITAVVPMIVLYLIAAIVIPQRYDGVPVVPGGPTPSTVAPGRGGLILGVLLVVIGVAALANQVLLVDWDLLWPVAFVALGGLLVLAASRR